MPMLWIEPGGSSEVNFRVFAKSTSTSSCKLNLSEPNWALLLLLVSQRKLLEFEQCTVIEYKRKSIHEFKSKEYLPEGMGSLGNAC